MQQRRTARVGLALAVLGVMLAVAGFWLAWGPGERSFTGLVHDNVLNNAANGVSISVLAGVLLWLRPDNRIGWLVLAVGLANSVTIFGTGWALATYHVDLPARAFFAWWGAWPWAPAFLLGSSLLLLVYPSGHTVSRFGHRLAVAAVVSAAGLAVSMSLLDGSYDGAVSGHDLGANPITRGHFQVPLVVLLAASAIAGVVIAFLTWGHTARRLWRASSPEREQLAWLTVAVVPTLVVAPLDSAWVEFAMNLLTTVALAIGILRYRLFDIKLVVRSGLVYGSLTALSVGAYFGVVALITTVTPSGPVPTLFAVAAVGLLVVPAHRLLQRFFGRLVYGDRGDPIRALHRVGEGMRSAASTDPEGLRPMLAGIAEALRSPRVAVYDADGVVTGVGAEANGHPVLRVPLEYAGARVGELVVAGRTERDGLGRADRRLVDALSGPVAAAVHAARTARELGESRARVLAVRESERTRLRADLHDGVGPSLSGISLGLEAAIGAVDTHPERVPEILDVVHREVGSLVSEVRGIIDDLGPVDVDLLAAVRRQVDAVVASGVCVALQHGGEVLSPGPAVSVAAQRIAGEALTNAVRHAQATRITVSVIDQGEHLVVEVCDDGRGVVAPRPGGVGLSSMRERAEAVGGTLHIAAAPGRGTVVRAVLPTGDLP
jgi:signal transduction histidine kinase